MNLFELILIRSFILKHIVLYMMCYDVRLTNLHFIRIINHLGCPAMSRGMSSLDSRGFHPTDSPLVVTPCVLSEAWLILFVVRVPPFY